MSNANEALKEYVATLGNNVDNFILNDIEAAYLAGHDKGIDKAAEVLGTHSKSCFGSLYSKQIKAKILKLKEKP